MKSARWLEIETVSADPIRLGELTIIQFARVVRVRAPFFAGGLTWVSPANVVIARNGQFELIAVRDVTRQVLYGLWGLALSLGLWLWWAGRRLR
jgi:hypothetical protein